MKIVSFRRYYRSVRHYAVTKLTESELKLKEERCAGSFIWRVIYNIDGRIFMRKPPVEIHSNMPKVHVSSEEQVKTALKAIVEQSLSNLLTWFRQTTASSTGTVEMWRIRSTKLMVTQAVVMMKRLRSSYWTNMQRLKTRRPILIGCLVTASHRAKKFRPKVRSTRKKRKQNHRKSWTVSRIASLRWGTWTILKVSGNDVANTSANLSKNGSFNGYSSDNENREKSKIQLSTTLDEQQMAELENQLVVKIMKHFKSTFNFSPTTTVLDDVFYSPIGEKLWWSFSFILI